jgi:hypothetical protein
MTVAGQLGLRQQSRNRERKTISGERERCKKFMHCDAAIITARQDCAA